MNSDGYSIFIRRELVREERCRDEKQTFGDVRTSARLHGARVVEIILALSREHISWWFIKRREPVYREPSTKEGEEGSQGVGWRTECGLTGRPSPAFSSIMDQERKKEREEWEKRETRERRELAQPPLDPNGLHWGARIFFHYLGHLPREKCNPPYMERSFS